MAWALITESNHCQGRSRALGFRVVPSRCCAGKKGRLQGRHWVARHWLVAGGGVLRADSCYQTKQKYTYIFTSHLADKGCVKNRGQRKSSPTEYILKG